MTGMLGAELELTGATHHPCVHVVRCLTTHYKHRRATFHRRGLNFNTELVFRLHPKDPLLSVNVYVCSRTFCGHRTRLLELMTAILCSHL